jgi:bifunctional non-homologous end joining protein LigD
VRQKAGARIRIIISNKQPRRKLKFSANTRTAEVAKAPPAGPGWIHEIKHDGFRVLAHRDASGVRLITRGGYDFADRFALAAAGIAALPARSCVVEGEAIACYENGLSVFFVTNAAIRS